MILRSQWFDTSVLPISFEEGRIHPENGLKRVRIEWARPWVDL